MDSWKFCAKSSSQEGCNFYSRYGVAKDSFEQVYWYYGGYCAMEGCILLLPGGILEAYFRDSVDEFIVGMIKGSWLKDDSTRQYILSYEKVAVAPACGADQPPSRPINESEAWKHDMANSIAISCDDDAPSGLPKLNGSQFSSVGRYQTGSRVLHGN
jgi:hypothetical protein